MAAAVSLPQRVAGARAVPSAPRPSLEQLQEQFHDFVKDNPGLRIEQINKQLGTTTKDLQLPIRKMIADGTILAKGSKRSTTYTVGKRKKGWSRWTPRWDRTTSSRDA